MKNQKKTLQIILGLMLLLAGVVAAGASAVALYLLQSVGADSVLTVFAVVSLAVAAAELGLGVASVIKAGKPFSQKPFIILDIVLVVLSAVITVVMGKSVPTQMLTGFIVPLLHIVILRKTR